MFRALTAAAFVSIALLSSAIAQSSSSSPITFLVPYAPGGSADIVARMIGQRLQDKLHRPVVIDNRPGGSELIVTEALARSAPDGATIAILSNAVAINETLVPNRRFDLDKDLSPVARLIELPFALMVHPSVPARSVQDFLAYAKANPGKVSFGSAGVGTIPHLAGELFKSMAKVDIVHVPYKGTSAAMNDLVGGHIHMMFDLLPSSLPQINSSRVRAIGNAGMKRPDVLADLPTISEQGLKGYDAASWVAVVAPIKTPAPVLAKLRGEMGNALKSPDIVKRLSDLGSVPGTADEAEMRQFLKTETDKWSKVIKDSGAKPK